MSKESISKNYLHQQKEIHTNKILPKERCAIVVGSEENNIGSSIADKLESLGFFVNRTNKSLHNLSKSEECEILFENSNADLLVLCNGYTNLNWIENESIDQINQILDDCLKSSIYATNYFVKKTLSNSNKKQIIYIGSMAHKNVLNASSVYCAAKAGLAMFARCMAWELAPKAYDVFCIHPSNTEGTPMTEKTITDLMRYRNIDREDAENYWGACLPKKDWLQPENIADVVEFLVSGKAEYLSGCNIDLAGGQR